MALCLTFFAGDASSFEIPLPRPRPKSFDEPTVRERWADKSADPALTLAPLPRPRPADRFHYFFTRSDMPTPIWTHDAPMERRFLKPDTLIRFARAPEPSTDGDLLIHFESVPLTLTETVVRGYMPLNFLGPKLGYIPSVENLELYLNALKVYEEKERLNQQAKSVEREQFEAQIDLRTVLSDFHNSKCEHLGAPSTEEELKLKWQAYIDYTMQTERGKRVAQNAMVLDLSARTVLYESQRKEQMPEGSHPELITCQWDVIALSIRNRAFARGVNLRSNYGASYEGDIIGAATDAQYNVWTKNFVNTHQDMLGCFLKRGHVTYLGNIYRRILDQIPETIGLVKDDRPIRNNNIDHRFELIGDNPYSYDIKDYRHYFHPKAMGRCHVGQRTAPIIKQGFLRISKGEMSQATNLKYNFESLVVIDGKVLGYEDLRIEKSDEKRRIYYGDFALPVYEWVVNFYQYKEIDGRNQWVLVPGEELFGGQVSLVDSFGLREAFELHHYACLPHGIDPKCAENDNSSSMILAQQGRPVPMSWFSRLSRDEMQVSLQERGFENAHHNFSLPSAYTRWEPGGVRMAIRCLSKTTKDESRQAGDQYPVLGGSCDSNIAVVVGVDQTPPD